MSWVRWVWGLGDLCKGVDGRLETFRCGLHIRECALGFGNGVNELGDLDLDEGDIELEVDLGGGNGEGALGILKGGSHERGGTVLFAFEEIDAAKAGEDLRVG